MSQIYYLLHSLMPSTYSPSLFANCCSAISPALSTPVFFCFTPHLARPIYMKAQISTLSPLAPSVFYVNLSFSLKSKLKYEWEQSIFQD